MSTLTEPKLIKHDPALIDPSPYQPRRKFDEEEMTKLTASIREVGLIQPLVARASPTKPDWLELIVGERRLRASKQAEVQAVSVLLRDIDDQMAEQMVLEENIQREDLTLSEEGHAYARLLAMRDGEGKAVHTQASLAAKIHQNVDYVKARLKLVICPPELIEAVDKKEVAISTAMLVGQIPDPKARAICAQEVLTPGKHGFGPEQELPMNYRQTQEMIAEHFMRRLDAKEFDPSDANLVPVKLDEQNERCQGGACTDCPFRTGNMEGVVLSSRGGGDRKSTDQSRNSAIGSHGAAGNLCTLPRCHKLKMDAVWREKKLKAEREGKKTLDGKAAEKAFGGRNGELAYDSGLTEIKHAQRVAGDHGVKLDALSVPRIVARHPDTFQVFELVDWPKTHAAILAAEEAAQKAAKGKPTPAALKLEEDEKRRRAEETKREKIDKLCVHEGLSEIVNHITGKGMGLEFLDLAFQLALGMSGADGMYCMGKWLEIKLPKGTANSGRDYEDEILKVLRERCQTSNAWLAHITVALIARGVKWSGVRCEDFELVLSHCGGVKVKELERRAKALFEGEAKAKKPVKPAPGVKEDWSLEKVNSTVAAADKLAKRGVDVKTIQKEMVAEAAEMASQKKKVRGGDMVRCFAAADAVGMVDAMVTAHVEPSEPNENGVFTEAQAFKMTVGKHVSFTIRLAAKRMEAGDDFDVGYCTGYEFECGEALRGSGGPKDGHVCAVLSAALLYEAESLRRSFTGASSKAAAAGWKALKEVIRLLKARAAKDQAAWNAKYNPPSAADGPIIAAAKRGIVCGEPGAEWLKVFDGDKGPGMMGRGPRGKGKSANAKDYAAAAAKKGQPAKVVKGMKELVEDWQSTADAGMLDAQVTRIRAGEGYPAVLGPRPAEGTPARKKWEAAKVRIWKTIRKLELIKEAKKKTAKVRSK